LGDDGVDRAALVGDLRLAHTVADHLAAAELHLLAIGGEILFDLDDQIGVGEPHPVAGGRAEHVDIGAAFDLERHDVLPSGLNSSPLLSTGPVSNAVFVATVPARSILVTDHSRLAPPVTRIAKTRRTSVLILLPASRQGAGLILVPSSG